MANLLIVDDELSMRQFLTHLFQRDGHAIRVAENGRKAMALLREHRSKLDDLALALLDRETLDGPDAYAAAGLEWVFTDEDLRDTAPAPA